MFFLLQNLDHSEGYYRVFPPKSYNVAIEQREASSTHVTRKVPILTKDVKKGETIYTEHPAVTVLDYDLLQSGSHCARCLKAIPSKVKAVKYTDSLLPATFCSQQCKSFAEDEYLSLIFTGKPVLPSTLTPIAPSPEAVDDRRRSQAAYLDYLKGADRKYGQGKSTRSLLTALFIGRQVTSEVQKIIDSVPNSPATPRAKTSKDDYTHADPSPTGTFNLAEHVERLRYLEVALAPDEPDLITAVLSKALPGLEPFVNGQSLAILSGKVTYNAFGVYFGEGRDSKVNYILQDRTTLTVRGKPNAESRPEDMQRTRTPVGTSRQVGSALYTLSSYLTHSCEPAARVTYPKGTAELHLVAERDLAKGDELTVAYIDVSPRGGESAADSRRRRMIELAYGWRFRCVCSRCEQDAPSQEKKGGKNTIEPKDESKEDIPEPKGLRNPLQGQV